MYLFWIPHLRRVYINLHIPQIALWFKTARFLMAYRPNTHALKDPIYSKLSSLQGQIYSKPDT